MSDSYKITSWDDALMRAATFEFDLLSSKPHLAWQDAFTVRECGATKFSYLMPFALFMMPRFMVDRFCIELAGPQAEEVVASLLDRATQLVITLKAGGTHV